MSLKIGELKALHVYNVQRQWTFFFTILSSAGALVVITVKGVSIHSAIHPFVYPQTLHPAVF